MEASGHPYFCCFSGFNFHLIFLFNNSFFSVNEDFQIEKYNAGFRKFPGNLNFSWEETINIINESSPYVQFVFS